MECSFALVGLEGGKRQEERTFYPIAASLRSQYSGARVRALVVAYKSIDGDLSRLCDSVSFHQPRIYVVAQGAGISLSKETYWSPRVQLVWKDRMAGRCFKRPIDVLRDTVSGQVRPEIGHLHRDLRRKTIGKRFQKTIKMDGRGTHNVLPRNVLHPFYSYNNPRNVRFPQTRTTRRTKKKGGFSS